MKLAIVFGEFNPPSIIDRQLFDHIAGYANIGTQVIVLTPDSYDRERPLGVLEKQEILSLMLSRDVELHMDYIHLLTFLKEKSGDYESITVIDTKEYPWAAQSAIRKFSRVPVEFDLIETAIDASEVREDLLASLHIADFDLFSKYYGGPDISAIEVFNKLKERIKCLS